MAIKQPDPLPDYRAKYVNPDGTPSVEFFRWLQFLDAQFRKTVDFANEPEPVLSFVLVEEWPIVVAFPANKDYKLSLDAAVEREVYEVVTICESGTCTVTIKTDATALGGTPNSASSTQQIQSHTTSNAWNVDEDLVATISSNSSCVGLTVTAKTRRTITL